MIIIRSMRFIVDAQYTMPKPWFTLCHNDEFSSDRYHGEPMIVELENTETGAITVHTISKRDRILEFFKQHNPYGFLDVGVVNMINSYYVAISHISLEFLKLVSSVKRVSVPIGENKKLDSIMLQDTDAVFTAVDKQDSIFSVGYKNTFLCTVFDAVALFKIGFIDGSYYLPYWVPTHKYEKDSYSAYKIEFTDQDAAKRFLAKYMTLYRSPFLEG